MREWDGAQRDKEAREIVAELYRKHRGAADGIIESVLGYQASKEDREDLIQEGFCRLLKHGSDLIDRTDGERFSYLCNTMQHLAVDEGRRRTKQKLVSFSEILENEDFSEINLYGISPEEQYICEEEWNEVSEFLRRVMAKLPQRDQDLLRERYFNQLSDRHVGKKLGIKEAFVRVYMDRAVKRAAKHYKAELEKERELRNQKAREDDPKE